MTEETTRGSSVIETLPISVFWENVLYTALKLRKNLHTTAFKLVNKNRNWGSQLRELQRKRRIHDIIRSHLLVLQPSNSQKQDVCFYVKD